MELRKRPVENQKAQNKEKNLKSTRKYMGKGKIMATAAKNRES